MKNISFNLNFFFLGLFISSGLIITHNSVILANSVNSRQSSLQNQNLQTKTTPENLVKEELPLNKSTNSKVNDIKVSSQQLVGTWMVAATNDSGEKYVNTIMYSSDGTFLHIQTTNSGDWFVISQGTWQVTNNILYENIQGGENIEGSVKFLSSNEFVYQSENSTTNWQKVNINQNLSANQLIGTWSIADLLKNGSSIIETPIRTGLVKLVKLNSDGTSNFKITDARVIVPGADIPIRRFSGTWSYINSGNADGLLLLKDSQGKLISIGRINWSSEQSFIYVNPSSIQSGSGKVERFDRSNLSVN